MRSFYKIEMFDEMQGFIIYDHKRNESSAETIADVISKSRKCLMRVVYRGQIIHQYDRRPE